MRIVRDFPHCRSDTKGAAVAIGNFDGVHLGHQEILRRCVDMAKDKNIPAAAMTFEPHPRQYFAGNGAPLRLYPLRRKIELLRDMGIDLLFLTRFNRALATLSPEAFVAEILLKQLSARHVVTGEDFAFGNGRGGDSALLARLAEHNGFGFTACPQVAGEDGQVISSTGIRMLLARGDVGKAAALLGRPYAIEGRVRHGKKRGRALGFPTANLALTGLFRPRFGIYAVRMEVGGSGQWQGGVASLGVNPTFGAFEPLLEAHGFAIEHSLYGQRLRVELAGFIRDEARFDSSDDLREQMADDCLKAKEMLNAYR
ncbi:MAG: bifunctional riboflavin kinase/FAD synthetase [Pseudomonadota bacterium]|nr:bifunctional riboflavin kinase/FAD synthetase [Pseudomonadota bacterium]MDE3036859.1 bifunctional riboflavin kinase/FAD synthetase [Pseudomonadota bacterium]